MKHYTSIKQSKKLLELGLSPESADMWWLYIPAKGDYIACTHEEPDPNYINRMKAFYGIIECAIPCWSVGALMDLLPEYIAVETESQIIYCYPQTYKQCFQYKGHDYIHDNSIILCEFRHSSYIENCFEMVCWLLENGYIKKGEQYEQEKKFLCFNVGF